MSAARYAWMDSALCAQADPDTWTDTPPGHGAATPKRICATCPVTDACAAHEQHLRNHQWEPLHGIWGGTSKRQRLEHHNQKEAA